MPITQTTESPQVPPLKTFDSSKANYDSMTYTTTTADAPGSPSHGTPLGEVCPRCDLELVLLAKKKSRKSRFPRVPWICGYLCVGRYRPFLGPTLQLFLRDASGRDNHVVPASWRVS